MRARALAGYVLGALVGAACAQPVAGRGPGLEDAATRAPTPYDRDALYPTPVTLYGLVNAGWRQRDVAPPRFEGDPCANSPRAPRRGIDSVERSYWGVRGTEILSGGLRAHLDLQQSFNADTGELRRPCGVDFDAQATVALSDRRWGRLDLGRIEQAAWLLTLRADPWRGNGSASPDWRLYAAPEAAATRFSGTLSYRSPDELPWRASLQLGRPRLSDGQGHAAENVGYRFGGSLAWDRLPWLLGAAWQAWPGDAWALPLVAVHDDGRLQASTALTFGRVGAAHYRNLFVGARWHAMALGDPERHEWRLGLNLHRVVDAPPAEQWASQAKLGFGWRYRYSKHAWVAVGAAVIKARDGALRPVFDVSLSYSFERNLRLPQWPL